MRVDEASASDAHTSTRSWLECGVWRVACGGTYVAPGNFNDVVPSVRVVPAGPCAMDGSVVEQRNRSHVLQRCAAKWNKERNVLREKLPPLQSFKRHVEGGYTCCCCSLRGPFSYCMGVHESHRSFAVVMCPDERCGRCRKRFRHCTTREDVHRCIPCRAVDRPLLRAVLQTGGAPFPVLYCEQRSLNAASRDYEERKPEYPKW